MLISQRRELLKLHPVLSWKLLANSFLIFQRFGIQDESHMVAEGEHISEMRKKIFELKFICEGRICQPQNYTSCFNLRRFTLWQDLIYGNFLNIQNYCIGMKMHPCTAAKQTKKTNKISPYDLKKLFSQLNLAKPERNVEKRGSHTAMKQHHSARIIAEFNFLGELFL